MGAILSEPVTAMVVERCNTPHWSAAVVTMQGWRRTHEDAHILCSVGASSGSEGSCGVFAVLDGHGGQTAAAKGSALLQAKLKQVAQRGTLSVSEASRALEESFLQCDASLREQLGPEDRSGSTVVAGIVTQLRPNEYCCTLAHAGDSRAVLFAGGRLHCSEDHKPNRDDERGRIEAAGGYVSQGPLGGGPMRVDGALAVSQAIGDFHFKPVTMEPARCRVSAMPDVQTVPGCAAGDWLLLACDGVFDVMENEEVKDFIEARLTKNADEHKDGGQVMVELLQNCLDKGSKDNCTACLVQLGMVPSRTSTQRSTELLQGSWRRAAHEVQNKYAEFFVAHGFEAEAKALQASAASARGPAPSGGRPPAASSSSGNSGVAQPPQSMAALTRALQAIRSTRAIQAAWRARNPDAKGTGRPSR
eukprot:TRINITY_DN57830_c0_g1_i1.p1 TRINITY_DN57830_c0_g1~~TRINITY_DN57830_c0_g1_i1.p1  ORF type:complete len:418 (+),score=79.60 TRINITY_DN57830_c0_g1_i1:86-1339(+)